MYYQANRHLPMRRLVLLAGDVAAIAGSMVLATVLRFWREGDAWQDYLRTHAPSLTAIGLIFLTVFYAGGMYERDALTRKVNCVLLPAVGAVIAAMLSMVMFYARFELAVGRGVLLLAATLIFLGSVAVRILFRVAFGRGFLSRNALLVGDGPAVENAAALLARTEQSGFTPLGIVRVSTPGDRGALVEGVPVLGELGQLGELVAANEIETLIVATAQDREPAVLGQLRPLRYAGVDVLDYVGLHEEIAQEIPLDHIDDEWLMGAALNSSVVHIRQVKRMLDVVAAGAGLAVTVPLCLLAAALIKLDSRGPVLYRQQRVRRGGAPYTLLKFRTMRPDAESESGVVWAGRRDDRVTRVGRLLRRLRIDEIPQLVNVLRGEMSLVGPRPERPEMVESLAGQIPFYRERLLVPPGITGWAQIRFPYAASVEASRRKLQFDLYYIKHMSLLLDLQILLQTFRTVLAGSRHSGESAAAAGGRYRR